MPFMSQQFQVVDFCLFYHLLETTSPVGDGCCYSIAEIGMNSDLPYSTVVFILHDAIDY
jgi:hypothetical protein